MQLRHPHPFLTPHGVDEFVAFAHRGGSSVHPENSLAAFSTAMEIGFRYLETDVQLTRDGVLVAFHDSNLLRTCGIDRDISTMSSKDLSDARIDGLEPIPFLADLFESFPEAKFNVDAKSDETVQPLIEFLARQKALERVCIGSFSHRRLRIVRSAFGDEVCTSASPLEVASWMAGRIPAGPSCVQIPVKQSKLMVVSQRRVERSHHAGVPVHIWTVDEPNEIQRLIDLGVHGIMTDDCSTLKEMARRNSLWK